MNWLYLGRKGIRIGPEDDLLYLRNTATGASFWIIANNELLNLGNAKSRHEAERKL